MVLLARLLPILRWAPLLDRATVQSDVAAGMTVAAMLVPQAMAYALLAGLPPEVGLYSATVPLLVYAVLGTSRQLAVGPVAISSLLTAAGLGAVMVDGSPLGEGTKGYLAAAALLAVMVGVIRILLGMGRLGFLVNFLGQPVLVGFTAAAALIIGFSQAKHLLGIDLPRTDGVVDTATEVLRHAGDARPVTLALGLSSLAAIQVLKRVAGRVPSALVVVIASTLAVKMFGLEKHGVTVVGQIPSSLPGFAVPSFELGLVRGLADTALVIAIVGFMESIAVAKVYARRNNYEVDANAELVGLGAANVAAGFFGGYPVNGGLSRTAVNASAGAKTPFASIVTAVLVLVTIAFLTPLFTSLPNAALAAIIISAVVGLIDVKEMVRIARVKRTDWVGVAAAFAGTLAFGVELGIVIGVAVMLATLAILRMKRPTQRPVPARAVGSCGFQLSGTLSFVNASKVKRQLLDRCSDSVGNQLRVDCSNLADLDTTGAAALCEVRSELAARDVTLCLVGARGPALQVMDRSGLLAESPALEYERTSP
ncbi:MAG: sulfate permease [Actinomycetota bacterium]|nr:sulfate permease [Actinomycetota bacterium]